MTPQPVKRQAILPWPAQDIRDLRERSDCGSLGVVVNYDGMKSQSKQRASRWLSVGLIASLLFPHPALALREPQEDRVVAQIAQRLIASAPVLPDHPTAGLEEVQASPQVDRPSAAVPQRHRVGWFRCGI